MISPTPLTQAAPAPDASEDTDHDASLVEEDLLVEEISIDGMCGVY
jgi:mycofactocin precursor